MSELEKLRAELCREGSREAFVWMSTGAATVVALTVLIIAVIQLVYWLREAPPSPG